MIFDSWLLAIWDRILQSFSGILGIALSFVVGWMIYGMLKEIRKAREMDHPHYRGWSSEEYFQHIKDEHPDIWNEYFGDEEE